MASKNWKNVERRIAKFFGSERNALSGGNGKVTRSDSLHARLFIESKHRERFAHHTLHKEAAEKADKEDKIPVVATHHHNQAGFMISIHSDDFLEVSKSFLESRGYKVLKVRKKP